MEIITWIMIIVCISQSAMFSGLNLAFFSVSKLRLEIEASKNNKQARSVLALRKDSNFLLVTILWGNVAVNVLLALLSGSVMAGVFAFIFSTVVITIVGEILPQAYFSRHAIQMASLLSPLLRIYQIILYPFAKPTAFVLDKWLGAEGINYYKEDDLKQLIKIQIESPETDIGETEGKGILNFLNIDDITIEAEGEIIDPCSILQLEFHDNKPVFPSIRQSNRDKFLKSVHSSHKKWIILVDEDSEPKAVLDASSFIRDALFHEENFNPNLYCHKPIIIHSMGTLLGDVIPQLKVNPENRADDVVDEDIIILWSKEKRVITGSDILGRLLHGIVQRRAI